ncbi:unnamed protein product [Gordionus sp. m RMFG-2023]
MIDITPKKSLYRKAIARSTLKLNYESFSKLQGNTLIKGNAIVVAKSAGIMAAKNTSNILTLCHNIPLDFINIKIEFNVSTTEVYIESEVKSFAKTGVEMEALIACSVASLSLYDMCKNISKENYIQDISLINKTKNDFF